MKYRGKIKITTELLKDLLKLDKNVDIIDVVMTEQDRDFDTFTIYLSSKEETNITRPINEGEKIPYVIIDGDIYE